MEEPGGAGEAERGEDLFPRHDASGVALPVLDHVFEAPPQFGWFYVVGPEVEEISCGLRKTVARTGWRVIIGGLKPSDDVHPVLLDGEAGLARDVVFVFSVCKRKSAKRRERVEDPMMVDGDFTANWAEERDAVGELVVTGHVWERGRRGVTDKPKLWLYAPETLLVDP